MFAVLQSLMHRRRADEVLAVHPGAVERSGWPSLEAASGFHRRSSDERPWFREGPEDPWDRGQPPAAKPWW